MNDEENIKLTVTKEEALVLFEFLVRFNQSNHPDIFEDQSEHKTLSILEGKLEKQLVEPFKPDYKNILIEARNKIRDVE
jgi:hypothetical protein